MARFRAPILMASAAVTVMACAPKEPPPPAPQEMMVRATDYAFEAPDTVTAGLTNVIMDMPGPGFHHVQFVRIDSGKTYADLEAALKVPGPPPAWAHFVAGPNPVNPGNKSAALVNLDAGNYAIICLVDIPDATPHFARGMMRPLTVVPASGAAAVAPTADVVVTMFDYNFTLSTPLTAGQHTVEIVNNGPQPHELFLMRLEPGKTLEDFGKWMAKPSGPPPATALGGISVAMPGAKAWVTWDLTPGNYALLCFVPDTKDGKPHMEHGMVQTLTIQ